MASAALRAQLDAHIASMYSTGAVDAYFQQLQSMEEGSAATGFVAEVINIFLNDADRILNDIAGLPNQPTVDFYKVDALVHQLIGSSSTVGAKKVKLACMHFRQSYVAKSKERCLVALALLRSEFCDVHNKLQTMMQLERKIAALSPM